ncbi:unnamed protein product [Amoebophrya sp. A120]|nr:unnamed protein product [Amoebophrya sp. A120]|eukprot:GSA120T00004031001.1
MRLRATAVKSIAVGVYLGLGASKQDFASALRSLPSRIDDARSASDLHFRQQTPTRERGGSRPTAQASRKNRTRFVDQEEHSRPRSSTASIKASDPTTVPVAQLSLNCHQPAEQGPPTPAPQQYENQQSSPPPATAPQAYFAHPQYPGQQPSGFVNAYVPVQVVLCPFLVHGDGVISPAGGSLFCPVPRRDHDYPLQGTGSGSGGPPRSTPSSSRSRPHTPILDASQEQPDRRDSEKFWEPAELPLRLTEHGKRLRDKAEMARNHDNEYKVREKNELVEQEAEKITRARSRALFVSDRTAADLDPTDTPRTQGLLLPQQILVAQGINALSETGDAVRSPSPWFPRSIGQNSDEQRNKQTLPVARSRDPDCSSPQQEQQSGASLATAQDAFAQPTSIQPPSFLNADRAANAFPAPVAPLAVNRSTDAELRFRRPLVPSDLRVQNLGVSFLDSDDDDDEGQNDAEELKLHRDTYLAQEKKTARGRKRLVQGQHAAPPLGATGSAATDKRRS